MGKEQLRQYNREYYKNHPERKEQVRQYNKQYYKDHPEIKENARAKNAEYYKKNKDKVKKRKSLYKSKEQNKETIRKQISRWYKNNPDKANVINRRNICRKKKFIDDIKLYYGCSNPNCCCARVLDVCCLDLHHVKSKEFSLAAAGGRSIKKIVEEIRKCVVLCAVCHRLVTHNKLDISKLRLCNVDDNGKIIL